MDEETGLADLVNALEGDLNAREAALRDSESQLEEGQAAFLRLTKRWKPIRRSSTSW